MEVFSDKLGQCKPRVFALRRIKKDLAGKSFGILKKCGIEGLVVGVNENLYIFSGFHIHVSPFVK